MPKLPGLGRRLESEEEKQEREKQEITEKLNPAFITDMDEIEGNLFNLENFANNQVYIDLIVEFFRKADDRLIRDLLTIRPNFFNNIFRRFENQLNRIESTGFLPYYIEIILRIQTQANSYEGNRFVVKLSILTARYINKRVFDTNIPDTVRLNLLEQYTTVLMVLNNAVSSKSFLKDSPKSERLALRVFINNEIPLFHLNNLKESLIVNILIPISETYRSFAIRKDEVSYNRISKVVDEYNQIIKNLQNKKLLYISYNRTYNSRGGYNQLKVLDEKKYQEVQRHNPYYLNNLNNDNEVDLAEEETYGSTGSQGDSSASGGQSASSQNDLLSTDILSSQALGENTNTGELPELNEDGDGSDVNDESEVVTDDTNSGFNTNRTYRFTNPPSWLEQNNPSAPPASDPLIGDVEPIDTFDTDNGDNFNTPKTPREPSQITGSNGNSDIEEQRDSILENVNNKYNFKIPKDAKFSEEGEGRYKLDLGNKKHRINLTVEQEESQTLELELGSIIVDAAGNLIEVHPLQNNYISKSIFPTYNLTNIIFIEGTNRIGATELGNLDTLYIPADKKFLKIEGTDEGIRIKNIGDNRHELTLLNNKNFQVKFADPLSLGKEFNRDFESIEIENEEKITLYLPVDKSIVLHSSLDGKNYAARKSITLNKEGTLIAVDDKEISNVNNETNAAKGNSETSDRPIPRSTEIEESSIESHEVTEFPLDGFKTILNTIEKVLSNETGGDIISLLNKSARSFQRFERIIRTDPDIFDNKLLREILGSISTLLKLLISKEIFRIPFKDVENMLYEITNITDIINSREDISMELKVSLLILQNTALRYQRVYLKKSGKNNKP